MSADIAIKVIEQERAGIEALSRTIWENPEGAFEERVAASKTAEFLGKHGFRVKTGASGLETAITATWGEGRPVIGFLGEYDALPGLSQGDGTARNPIDGQAFGHGCGHNLLGAATAGAVVGLKAGMERRGLKGTIVFYGCPAEERIIGKVIMASRGAFDGLDAAVSFHPSSAAAVSLGSSAAMQSARFHFTGKASHAAGDPQNGRSALDAVELTNVGANYLREHIPQEARLHYVITDGGAAPNIVPDKASVWYFVRAPKRHIVKSVYDRLVKVAEGAALMTETKLEAKSDGGCYETLNNRVLANELAEAMKQVEQEPWTEAEIAFAEQINQTAPEAAEANRKKYGQPDGASIFTGRRPFNEEYGAGSTDVGDVGHITPTIFFTTTCFALGTPGHSWQATACSGSSIGQKGMIRAAKIMAAFGARLLENPLACEDAKREFLEAMEGQPYKAALPDKA